MCYLARCEKYAGMGRICPTEYMKQTFDVSIRHSCAVRNVVSRRQKVRRDNCRRYFYVEWDTLRIFCRIYAFPVFEIYVVNRMKKGRISTDISVCALSGLSFPWNDHTFPLKAVYIITPIFQLYTHGHLSSCHN